MSRHSRSVVGSVTEEMTTPEVKTPTGFADIGVPERIDAGLAAALFLFTHLATPL